MKTKLFLGAAILLAGSAMSQTVSSDAYSSSHAYAAASSVQKNTSASSAVSSRTAASANVNTSSNTEAAAKTAAEIKGSGETAVRSAKGEVKRDYREVKARAETERSASVGVGAHPSTEIEASHNKQDVSTSINTGADVSARGHFQSGANVTGNSHAKVKAPNRALNPRISSGVRSGSSILIR